MGSGKADRLICGVSRGFKQQKCSWSAQNGVFQHAPDFRHPFRSKIDKPNRKISPRHTVIVGPAGGTRCEHYVSSAGTSSPLVQQTGVILGSVLDAAVGVMHQTRRRNAAPESHPQGQVLPGQQIDGFGLLRKLITEDPGLAFCLRPPCRSDQHINERQPCLFVGCFPR